MSLIFIAGMLLIFALAVALLGRAGLYTSAKNIVISTSLLAAALLLRLAFFDYETLDFQDFLRPWVQYFANNGGFAALANSVGNYNVPYLYFLALFSYFPDEYWLHLIKLLSVCFEMMLAYAAAALTGLYVDSAPRKLIAFFGTLFLPTVLLNGSVWGQCDVMHTGLGVLGLYLGLSDRPIPAMAAFAAAFAVKLQAIFLLPVIVVLWLMGKFKLWHTLVFPVTYVLIVLPAVLMGRPFWDTVMLYANQTGSIGSGLNYNSSSIFAFFPYEDQLNLEFCSTLGIVAAFAFMLFLLGWCAVRYRELDKYSLLTVALLLCIGIPFFLPHMHDRYFFLADAVSLIFAVVLPRFFWTPALVQFASLLGYHAYLKLRYLLPMRYGAMALIICLVVLTAFLEYLFQEKQHKKSV